MITASNSIVARQPAIRRNYFSAPRQNTMAGAAGLRFEARKIQCNLGEAAARPRHQNIRGPHLLSLSGPPVADRRVVSAPLTQKEG